MSTKLGKVTLNKQNIIGKNINNIKRNRVPQEREDHMSNTKTGLDGRVRDHDGEIRHKRSDTKVGTLRSIYGENFASGGKNCKKICFQR